MRNFYNIFAVFSTLDLVLAVAQFFGLFPVVNVFSKNVDKIRFKFVSLRTLHSSMFIAGATFFAVLETLNLYQQKGLNPKNISK